MLCKILRSAAKNGSPNRFFNALVRIPNFKLPFKKNDRIIPIVLYGGRLGIRSAALLNYQLVQTCQAHSSFAVNLFVKTFRSSADRELNRIKF